VSEDLYGWVILSKKEWKPCMRSPCPWPASQASSCRGWQRVRGAGLGPDGRIYLVDGITYALWADTKDCNRTAKDIVNKVMEEVLALLAEEGDETSINREEILQDTASIPTALRRIIPTVNIT